MVVSRAGRDRWVEADGTWCRVLQQSWMGLEAVQAGFGGGQSTHLFYSVSQALHQ